MVNSLLNHHLSVTCVGLDLWGIGWTGASVSALEQFRGKAKSSLNAGSQKPSRWSFFSFLVGVQTLQVSASDQRACLPFQKLSPKGERAFNINFYPNVIHLNIVNIWNQADNIIQHWKVFTVRFLPRDRCCGETLWFQCSYLSYAMKLPVILRVIQ